MSLEWVVAGEAHLMLWAGHLRRALEPCRETSVAIINMRLEAARRWNVSLPFHIAARSWLVTDVRLDDGT